MRSIRFRVWHYGERKMYFCGYQKLFAILLCDDDHGTNEGRGLPVKRARYDECEMLEAAGLIDNSGCEIFEGDIVRLNWQGREAVEVVAQIPDMFRSRGLHQLQVLLDKHAIADGDETLCLTVLGNQYEHPSLIAHTASS
ncbi:MAG: YopX family protein [Candidatus Omnitrophota bacterium]|nr:YopX family protein [Candidatus Omnitrophota bacterium]